MLSIQSRIEKYHYAYGLWPDSYQSAHPYSMHEYFDKKTLNMFDRAFMQNQKRPTAKEWQQHIEELFTQLKSCKNNPDHAYFTAKGCGLCVVEQKIKQTLQKVKDESQMPVKIRGMELSELSTEKNKEIKKQKHREFIKLNKIALIGIVLYFIFFSSLHFILSPFKSYITSGGYFLQLLFIALIIRLIYKATEILPKRLPLLNNEILLTTLKIYAIINILVAFVLINDLSLSVLELAK